MLQQVQQEQQRCPGDHAVRCIRGHVHPRSRPRLDGIIAQRDRGSTLDHLQRDRHGRRVVRQLLAGCEREVHHAHVVVARERSMQRRLKFAEALTGAHEDLKEDPLARRDADFLLMSEAVGELWQALLKAFGGLEQ